MRLLKSCFTALVLLCVPPLFAIAQVQINFPTKDAGELEDIRTKPGSARDVDLNGLWEGEITQLTWQGQPEFSGAVGKLHVEISQKGSKVEGLLVCRAKFADNKGYLSYEKTFKGHWDGVSLRYEDVAVDHYINTHREMRHMETCMKKANLEFFQTNNRDHLEGEWSGFGHVSDVYCVPGKIHLKRIREDEIVSEVANTVNVNFEQTGQGPVQVKWDNKKRIKKLSNRKVKDGKVIKVDSTYLSITVYDHKRNDGDIISLNYNGHWILEQFRINNEEHKVDVVLDASGKVPNYLALYAHNLGDYPPNTVAIIVDDGVKRQRFILNSDMNTCDVIYFVRE